MSKQDIVLLWFKNSRKWYKLVENISHCFLHQLSRNIRFSSDTEQYEMRNLKWKFDEAELICTTARDDISETLILNKIQSYHWDSQWRI